jgi:hypothetical protein
MIYRARRCILNVISSFKSSHTHNVDIHIIMCVCVMSVCRERNMRPIGGGGGGEKEGGFVDNIFKGKLLKCCWMKQMTFHVPLPMFWLLKCFT